MSDFNQTKYIQEYQKEKYDRCIFNLKKGEREILKVHYEAKGYKSLNQYVLDLIKKDMEADKTIIVGDINQQGENNSITIG